MRLPIMGVSYDVDFEDLPEGVHGEHRSAEARLVISSLIAVAQHWPALKHEIGHAAFCESDCRRHLESLLRAACPNLGEVQIAKLAEDLEEIICGTYTTALTMVLENMGWLHSPGEVK